MAQASATAVRFSALFDFFLDVGEVSSELQHERQTPDKVISRADGVAP
jgi:hypothetical protein